MRFTLITITSVFALAMGACSPTFTGYTATGARPMGAASSAPGAASKEPESANSLPQGASVAGPVTNRVGNVGTTRY